jgi:hypothetical protein
MQSKQEPLATRKEGEGWAEMGEAFPLDGRLGHNRFFARPGGLHPCGNALVPRERET